MSEMRSVPLEAAEGADDMEKRTHSVSKVLRMTPDEAKLLKEKSDEEGLSESGYLRLMLTQKPNDYQEIRVLLKQLINEVNHIGTNINQIAHRVNGGYYTEGDKDRLFAYLRKIDETVSKVVGALGYQ